MKLPIKNGCQIIKCYWKYKSFQMNTWIVNVTNLCILNHYITLLGYVALSVFLIMLPLVFFSQREMKMMNARRYREFYIVVHWVMTYAQWWRTEGLCLISGIATCVLDSGLRSSSQLVYMTRRHEGHLK